MRKLRKVLQIMGQERDYENMKKEIEIDNDNATLANDTIFLKKYGTPLLLAFLMAFFNQLSGINAFLILFQQDISRSGS